MPDSQSVRLAGRLFDLVHLIWQHPKEYTAARLADYFHTSVRTVRRDIRTLEDVGIRVESEPGGGYFIMQDLRRMPAPLNDAEKMVLEIMPSLLAGALAHGRVHPLLSAYQRAMEKLLNHSFPPAQQAALVADGASPSLAAGMNETAQSVQDGVILEILQAIRRSHTLRMVYRKITSPASEVRLVDPYALVPEKNSLYIVGYCHLRRAFRTFKVVRIESAECLPQPFTRQREFSLSQFLRSAWGIDQSGPESDIHLLFTAEAARYAKEEISGERLLSTTEWPDGRYEVWVRTHWNREFQRFLLQYGADVEVLEPAALRADMRREIEAMKKRYRTDVP
ncbi:helix-turn-helix transcriptional regulator [Alicyclobacillus kakegawensis]|uniref:helix-turn-helix transcriptional regulator n=1 Tax=Alicyclobacillus kakegawensis TaxID=392012 RepID=UPI0012EECE47|nr:WYL domain-containing protein [Alicyclobacillus kakegawensis]